MNFLEVAKQEARIKALKSIKPIAEINGVKYFTKEEHQKFIDAIDPNDKVYIRQKDEETGKTIFNGVNRIVIDPVVFFAITYWIDEENGLAHFITDPLAIYAKNNSLEFKRNQVQGFTTTLEDGVLGKEFTRKYFNRDEFVNKFSGNLYEDDPKMAIELFKTLSQVAGNVKSEVAFKLK